MRLVMMSDTLTLISLDPGRITGSITVYTVRDVAETSHCQTSSSPPLHLFVSRRPPVGLLLLLLVQRGQYAASKSAVPSPVAS